MQILMSLCGLGNVTFYSVLKEMKNCLSVRYGLHVSGTSEPRERAIPSVVKKRTDTET